MPNVWKDVSACDNAAIQILVQRLGAHYKLRFSTVWGQFFHRKMSFILSPAKRTFQTSNPLWPLKIVSSQGEIFVCSMRKSKKAIIYTTGMYSRTNPNNLSKRDVKHFCFQHFLKMPRTISVHWHVIDVIALSMMEICLTLIRVDSDSRQQIPSSVKGTNKIHIYRGKTKLRNLFGKLFWDIYFTS